MDDDRPYGRRASDDDEWRGTITERVRTHDQKLSSINGDLREVWKGLNQVSVTNAALERTVSDLSDDLGNAMSEIARNRQSELDGLRDAIERHRGPSRKDLLVFVVFPIVVGIIVGLILFAITSHTGVHFTPPVHR